MMSSAITATRFQHRFPDRLDWYTLRALIGPLLVALQIVATLVPHYMGMALPAAFFSAIFMAVARIGDDNELDAMLATGRSITRMEDNRFVSVRQGFSLGADDVGPDGRQLRGVFVERRNGDKEDVITAQHGRLVSSTDGKRLLLELTDGLIVSDLADGRVRMLNFASGRINEDFTVVPPPYRARGGEVRELTLTELWSGWLPANSKLTQAELAGEMHGRMARILLPLLLPLLALPLGMAAKRGRRAPGTVFAAVALLALNQALQFGESMAESGRAQALISVWTPVLLFAVLGVWLFRGSLQWPGDNPVMRAVSAIESGFEGIKRRRKVKTA